MPNLSTSQEPLVSILTPVYNGGRFLKECIKSIINQQYRNWEYIIVNNCSTDYTLEIATSYEKNDNRIKVVTNDKFVNCEENHNIAFKMISKDSKYCKVVSADDWISNDCISKLVKLAEANPSVGIVGSYQQYGNKVRWKGLPYDMQFISGREICRLSLINKIAILGNPTSVLYRSDLIRKNNPFFPHLLPHADTSAAYKYLQECDFGFVHEVLSTTRIHPYQESSKVTSLGMNLVENVEHLLVYGPIYLNKDELESEKKIYFDLYYRKLCKSLLNLRAKDFWEFQISRMRELGFPIIWSELAKSCFFEVKDQLRNPIKALSKIIKVIIDKL